MSALKTITGALPLVLLGATALAAGLVPLDAFAGVSKEWMDAAAVVSAEASKGCPVSVDVNMDLTPDSCLSSIVHRVLGIAIAAVSVLWIGWCMVGPKPKRHDEGGISEDSGQST